MRTTAGVSMLLMTLGPLGSSSHSRLGGQRVPGSPQGWGWSCGWTDRNPRLEELLIWGQNRRQDRRLADLSRVDGLTAPHRGFKKPLPSVR